MELKILRQSWLLTALLSTILRRSSLMEGKRAVSQGREAVRLKTGKGISDRIVSARDVSSREYKVVFERLMCDCSNEVNYLGGLGVFRVYDGNQTCCHTTCGSFYQTSGE